MPSCARRPLTRLSGDVMSTAATLLTGATVLCWMQAGRSETIWTAALWIIGGFTAFALRDNLVDQHWVEVVAETLVKVCKL